MVPMSMATLSYRVAMTASLTAIVLILGGYAWIRSRKKTGLRDEIEARAVRVMLSVFWSTLCMIAVAFFSL